MGIKIPPPWIYPPPPDPVPPGDPCTNCWGTGKTFGDGDTPSKIQVTFAGIRKGPNWTSGCQDPFAGTLDVEQYPGGCSFSGWFAGFIFELQWSPVATYILLIDSDSNRHFEHNFYEACSLFVPNDLDDIYSGGSALIVLPEVV